MREIKFRGKRHDNGDWVYGFVIVQPMSVGIKAPYIYDGEYEYRIQRGTCGQFTGLNDRNGKEIYDGDVVRDQQGIGEVEWVMEHCAFCIRAIEPHAYHLIESDGQLRNTEVIGNIYENPELLTKEA